MSTSTPGISLPYDVWLNIASFIPPDALIGLYGVNRALFDLALSERYRVVQLSHPERRSTRECLKRLSDDPFRTSKARVLNLRLSPFGQTIPKGERFEWKDRIQDGFEHVYLKSSHQKKGSKEKKHRDEPRVVLQRLLKIIGSLTNVQECSVEYTEDDILPYFQAAIPLVLAGWAAFGAQLRTLQLTVPIESLDSMSLPQLRFERLESLDVEIFLVFRSTDPLDIMNSSLVPFINNNHDLLHTFRLRTSQHLDLTPVFDQLRPMPLLCNFDFCQGYVSTLQTDTSGLHQFLSNHAENLHSLKLYFYALGTNLIRDPLMEDWFQQPCLNVAYPHLSNLTFGLCDFPTGFGIRIDAFLSAFWGPLTSLGLCMELKQREVEAVLSQIPPGINKLRSLQLEVGLVTPALFDTLAKRLPDLQELVLYGDDFSGDEGRSVRNRSSFCSAMKSRSYPTWKLRDLTITSNPFSSVTKKFFLIAVLKALPALYSFNDSLREICLPRYIAEVQASRQRHQERAACSNRSSSSVSSIADESFSDGYV